MPIHHRTTLRELAALVSQTLESAGITATLSGGAAVSIYTENRYQSNDLDFVTAERQTQLTEALAPLGFELAADKRHFEHPNTNLFVESPPALSSLGAPSYSTMTYPR